MRPVSDAQVRKLMEELNKHGHIGVAAMKSDMDRKTGRKYAAAKKLPSEMTKARNWRTRSDPFREVWPEVVALLKVEAGLDAKTVFEVLQANHPGRFVDGQLRTLQRQVRQFRAAHGGERNVVLAQRHRPGEAMQTDFTSTTELQVTICGAPLSQHQLCNSTLPYSNWRWATVCASESIAAIRQGVQRALFQLGRVPEWHQTDNSTAATHQVSSSSASGERAFNSEYVSIMNHFGMKPRTTEVGAKEQNGDVEASNGALKRALEQMLLVRGSRDFASVEAWQSFVDDVNRKCNKAKSEKVTEDLAAMRELNVAKLPEYVELQVVVSSWSTVHVKHATYSVPSRLIGETVRVRLFESRVELWFAGVKQLDCERVRGQHPRRIDYRHVIWSLVRKPGGFRNYVFREEMFPSTTFRRAYDAIHAPQHRGVAGDLEYLRILHVAATTMESEVEAALDLLLNEQQLVSVDAVKALVAGKLQPRAPSMVPPTVDLRVYDSFLAVSA
jgi:transposase